MRKLKLLISIIILVSLVSLSGCASKRVNDAMDKNGADGTQNNGDSSSQYSLIDDLNRKIIYTVNLDVQTKDLENYRKVITEKLDIYDGYIESDLMQDDYSEITVRVKSEHLDLFIDSIEGDGETTYYSKTSEDITLNYASISARKESLEAQHERIMQFIEEAANLSDLLELERFRAEVEEELNYIISEINKYDSLTEYSVVKLQIRENDEEVEKDEDGFFYRVGNSFSSSLLSLFDLCKLSIIVVSALIPYALAMFVGFILVRVVMKGYKKYKK